MYKLILLTYLAPALAWSAPLKILNCENNEIMVTIIPSADLVEWAIVRKADGAALGRFSGYIFASGDLDSFGSTDDGSDVEVDGPKAVVSYGDVTGAELTCH